MTLADLRADAMARIAEDSMDTMDSMNSMTFFNVNDWNRWLNDGQRAFVRQTKILQGRKMTLTVPGQQDYPMDTDFWTPRLVKYDIYVLKPFSVDELEIQSPASSTGTPVYYTVWERQILLWPTPSVEKTLLVYYYRWPVEMMADTDVPEIPEAFHGVLPAWAAYRAMLADQNPSLADRYLREFNDGVMEALAALTDNQDQGYTVRDVRGGCPWA